MRRARVRCEHDWHLVLQPRVELRVLAGPEIVAEAAEALEQRALV
jgi:hypothetical protein